jgi:hypothetical protein
MHCSLDDLDSIVQSEKVREKYDHVTPLYTVTLEIKAFAGSPADAVRRVLRMLLSGKHIPAEAVGRMGFRKESYSVTVRCPGGNPSYEGDTMRLEDV